METFSLPEQLLVFNNKYDARNDEEEVSMPMTVSRLFHFTHQRNWMNVAAPKFRWDKSWQCLANLVCNHIANGGKVALQEPVTDYSTFFTVPTPLRSFKATFSSSLNESLYACAPLQWFNSTGRQTVTSGKGAGFRNQWRHELYSDSMRTKLHHKQWNKCEVITWNKSSHLKAHLFFKQINRSPMVVTCQRLGDDNTLPWQKVLFYFMSICSTIENVIMLWAGSQQTLVCSLIQASDPLWESLPNVHSALAH